MHADLERLERLDHLDRELTKHQRAIDAGQTSLEEARGAVTERQKTREAAEAALAENRKQQLALQRDIQGHETNRDRAVKALEMGHGDAAAAERQIERTTALIDEVETRQLELLEAQDSLEGALEAAEQELVSAQEHLTGLEASVPEARAAHESAMALLSTERAEVHDALPADLARRYGDLRSRNKWAVAHIVDGACSACRVDVPAQQQADLKRGLIVPCRRCHRWVVPAAS